MNMTTEIKEIKEEDWRGILALGDLIITGASILLTVAKGDIPLLTAVSSILTPQLTIVLNWYFRSKGET